MPDLFRVSNHHIAGCGTPPSIDGDGRWCSYFQNPHGEQWIVAHEAGKPTARVYSGDVGWGTELYLDIQSVALRAKDGRLATDLRRSDSTIDTRATLILGESEKSWLISCCMALRDSCGAGRDS